MANKFMLGKDVDRENILVAELKVDEDGDLLLYINGRVALYLQREDMTLCSTSYADDQLGIRAYGMPGARS